MVVAIGNECAYYCTVVVRSTTVEDIAFAVINVIGAIKAGDVQVMGMLRKLTWRRV